MPNRKSSWDTLMAPTTAPYPSPSPAPPQGNVLTRAAKNTYQDAKAGLWNLIESLMTVEDPAVAKYQAQLAKEKADASLSERRALEMRRREAIGDPNRGSLSYWPWEDAYGRAETVNERIK